MEYSKWPLFTLRAFAFMNFMFVALGLYFLGFTALAVKTKAVGNTPDQPYFIPCFRTMTAVNVCFLCALILGSIYLLRTRMFGVAICNAVFAAEILYFISVSLLWSPVFSKNVSMMMSIAAATGVGNMGINAQVLCGYPLIALISLNLARRVLNRRRS